MPRAHGPILVPRRVLVTPTGCPSCRRNRHGALAQARPSLGAAPRPDDVLDSLSIDQTPSGQIEG